MTILWTAPGVAYRRCVVHDVFTVLFRPGAQSWFSGALARAIWALLRRARTAAQPDVSRSPARSPSRP